MRKIIVLLTIVSFAVTSCKAPKAAMQKRNLISGTWSLDNVSYESGEGIFKGILFNDAKDVCFEGSDWFFRDNNSTGRYTITAGSLCNGGDRSIRWSVVENQLQFKFIDEKRKDIAGGQGYRLDITNLTAEEMVLKSRVMQDGQAVSVVYEFSKK